jgi:hypothetical protein
MRRCSLQRRHSLAVCRPAGRGYPNVWRAHNEEDEVEHDEHADRLERDAEKLEHESDRVGGHIEETRSDWEAKEKDSSVPGAQPEIEDEEPEPDED